MDLPRSFAPLAELLELMISRAGPENFSPLSLNDASWVGYYEALHQLSLARYGPDETDHLADWAALVRSCGWWWPGEDVCVVAERPRTVHTEP